MPEATTISSDMDIDRANLIAEDLKEAIKSVCEKHSVEPRIFGGRHDDLSYECRLEFNVTKVDEYGRKLDKYAIAFQTYAANYGIDPDHLFKEVEIDGTKWIIAGIDKASKKSPILLKEAKEGGKTISYAHGVVVDQLARQAVKETVDRRKADYVPSSRPIEMESEGW